MSVKTTTRGGKAPEKKFKGKKKVKTIEDKVKKGLHLNKVDRRKIVKLEEKRKINEDVNKYVKQELEKLTSSPRQRRLSSCSESSFGSAPPPKKEKRKSVTFPDKIEHVKVFDKINDEINAKASSASPGRSILAKKIKAQADAKMKKAAAKVVRQLDVEQMDTTDGEKENTSEEKLEKPIKKVGTLEGKIKKGGKTKVQVTKKVKEQLLSMDKKERKKFLLELKAKKKPVTVLAQECKQLWEKLRVKKTPQEDKEAMTTQLVGMIKGHAKELIYAHDTCRIFQYLLRLEREGITALLFDELSSEFVRMCKSPYARFFAKRLLKFGTRQQRTIIIDSFRGHAVSMFKNVWAAEILESVYNEYGNAQQRFDILVEFYGKEFVVFRSDTIKTLHQIIEEEPGKKKLIVQYLEEIIMSIIEKTTVKCSLAHRILLDFITNCDKEQRQNLIDSLKDKIPEIVHTPDGSKVAMNCIWHSDAKDRKLMVKNFKDLAVSGAIDKHGQKVLYAIFDNVDDTKLINKYITEELANNVARVVRNCWGVHLAQYIVHPRDGRQMDFRIITELQQGDNNEFSKKPKADRYSAIFNCLVKPLCTFLAANMEEMLFEKSAQQTTRVVLSVLQFPMARDLFQREVDPEDRAAMYDAIVELCKEEFIPMNPERYHIVEDKFAGYVLGQLILFDKNLPEEQRISFKITQIDEESFGSWISCNKGCFALLRMYENGGDNVQERIKNAVNMTQLAKYSYPGAKILKDALCGVPTKRPE